MCVCPDDETEPSKYKEQNNEECNYDSNPNPYDSSQGATAEDFGRYRSLVQSGQFYEFMAEQLEGQFTRDKLKKRVLADVIAKRKASDKGAEYPSPIEDKFRELFPTVYRYIRHVNECGWEHENLIRMLQREESQLVIETVAADLTSRFPDVFFITLHDAIYTTPEHLSKVEEAFRWEFERTGFPMKLKVER